MTKVNMPLINLVVRVMPLEGKSLETLVRTQGDGGLMSSLMSNKYKYKRETMLQIHVGPNTHGNISAFGQGILPPIS